MDTEELHRKLELDIARSKQLISKLLQDDLVDEDGYPTDSALEIIEKWHWTDITGWFKFISQQWYYYNWGWKESIQNHEIWPDRTVTRYNISTAGWSGNESIIRAMKSNEMMWHLTWVQSRRGGHYIFEDDHERFETTR